MFFGRSFAAPWRWTSGRWHSCRWLPRTGRIVFFFGLRKHETLDSLCGPGMNSTSTSISCIRLTANKLGRGWPP